MTAQVSCHLFQELKALGIDLPDNAQEITIVLPGYQEAVYVFVKGSPWYPRLTKHKYFLVNSKGKKMMSEEFINLAKDVMKLPDEITAFSIKLAPDEIVTTTIECATPSGSLSFLKGHTLVSKFQLEEQEKAIVSEKVKKVLQEFKTKKPT